MLADDTVPVRCCYIDIVAGLGGDESIIYADMMLAMYSLWAYNHHLPFEIVEPLVRPGGSAMGRAKLRIVGADPTLLAARENGIHRMIRIPPYKTQRHMSFVYVRVSATADARLPEAHEGWGDQIRSLVVNPEAFVKNDLTGFICRDTVGVFAGDLDMFWEERT